jgi:hypothetical protein
VSGLAKTFNLGEAFLFENFLGLTVYRGKLKRQVADYIQEKNEKV